MKFTIKMTAHEKRAVYERALGNLERQLLSLLLEEGFDPNKFDEDTFEPVTFPGQSGPSHGQILIQTIIENIKRIRVQLENLQ
jgi:hypothetical protein